MKKKGWIIGSSIVSGLAAIITAFVVIKKKGVSLFRVFKRKWIR